MATETEAPPESTAEEAEADVPTAEEVLAAREEPAPIEVEEIEAEAAPDEVEEALPEPSAIEEAP